MKRDLDELSTVFNYLAIWIWFSALQWLGYPPRVNDILWWTGGVIVASWLRKRSFA